MSIPSFEKINYSLRPAKNIQRKMIVEALNRLRAFNALDSYRYVGFGSPYFSDFSLVHRALGIQNMVCIERESHRAERFEFNRPFNCIELKFGESSVILPSLDWEEIPTIIWLDYDGAISRTVLSDIDIVCSSLTAGSFFLVTIRGDGRDFGQNPDERLDQIKTELGNRLPSSASPSDAKSENFGKLLWQMLDSEIRRVVIERGAAFDADSRLKYEQVLHFAYSDSTPMLTVGGIVYQNEQRARFTECNFAKLPYSRSSGDVYRIEAPPLTFKEMRALDAQLPGACPSLAGLPDEQVQQYAEHYRYFPNYVEAEF